MGYFLNHHWIWWFFRIFQAQISAFQPPLGVHKIQPGPGLVQMSESHSASSSATASLVLFWCFGKGAKVEITSINMAQLIIYYFRFVFWFIPWKLDLQCFRGVETSDQRRFQTNGLTNWSSKDGNATNQIMAFNQERDWRSNLQNGEAAYRIMFCHAYVYVQIPADLFVSLRMMIASCFGVVGVAVQVFSWCVHCSCNLPKMHRHNLLLCVFHLWVKSTYGIFKIGWFPHQNALKKSPHHI